LDRAHRPQARLQPLVRIFTSDADGANRKNVTKGYQADWQPVVG
jgi:hypothetical protein